MSNADSGEELRKLDRGWEQITTVPEKPRSLLDVLGYSLSDKQRAEVYVNRLLGYFLDPEEPHGMDEDLLRRFLRSVPDDLDFDEDTYDLSGVNVETQVLVEDDATGERSGYADLLVESPSEWFLLAELKFSAEENNVRGDGRSQTEFYRDAPFVAGRSKDEYESGQYYLYVRPDGSDDAASGAFTNWTWSDISSDVLESVLAENAPRYPQRTVAQLREFVDDLTELTGMTEQDRAEQEKIDLYLEHFDAIEDVSSTFDEHWDDLNDEWATRLGRSLTGKPPEETAGCSFRAPASVDSVSVDAMDSDQWAVVEAESGDTGPEQWIFRAKDNDWAHLFKEGWWKSKDGLETLYARDPNREDVRLSLIHRFGNRTAAVGDRELHVYVRNCGSNDEAFRTRFNEVFEANRSDIQEVLPKHIEFAGEKRNKLEATYDIPVAEHDTFAAAYVAAVETAFLDFAVENQALIDELDTVYESALAVYTDG